MSTAMAAAHVYNGQFQEAVPWAENALAQNPRNNSARRLLAASLASLGHSDKAAARNGIFGAETVAAKRPGQPTGTERPRHRQQKARQWRAYVASLHILPDS